MEEAATHFESNPSPQTHANILAPSFAQSPKESGIVYVSGTTLTEIVLVIIPSVTVTEVEPRATPVIVSTSDDLDKEATDELAMVAEKLPA